MGVRLIYSMAGVPTYTGEENPPESGEKCGKIPRLSASGEKRDGRTAAGAAAALGGRQLSPVQLSQLRALVYFELSQVR